MPTGNCIRSIRIGRERSSGWNRILWIRIVFPEREIVMHVSFSIDLFCCLLVYFTFVGSDCYFSKDYSLGKFSNDISCTIDVTTGCIQIPDEHYWYAYF